MQAHNLREIYGDLSDRLSTLSSVLIKRKVSISDCMINKNMVGSDFFYLEKYRESLDPVLCQKVEKILLDKGRYFSSIFSSQDKSFYEMYPEYEDIENKFKSAIGNFLISDKQNQFRQMTDVDIKYINSCIKNVLGKKLTYFKYSSKLSSMTSIVYTRNYDNDQQMNIYCNIGIKNINISFAFGLVKPSFKYDFAKLFGSSVSSYRYYCKTDIESIIDDASDFIESVVPSIELVLIYGFVVPEDQAL